MGFKNLKEDLPGILPAAKIMEKVLFNDHKKSNHPNG
jgi:hypothetical protein